MVEQKAKYEKFNCVENRNLTRLLIVVLIGLGISCIICAFTLTEIAWVLVICFLYVLALEVILITSTNSGSTEDLNTPYNPPLTPEAVRNNDVNQN
jgi:hypothetical protein